MKDEAYILREWWKYLEDRNVSWNVADDQLLVDWREELVRSGQKMRRIERKLDVIFTFYRCIDGICKQNAATLNAVITSKKRGDRKVWSGARRASSNTAKRPTPHEHAVRKILSQLRANADNPADAERNWLIGLLIVETGLRRSEVISLTLDHLEDAFYREGITVPRPPTLKRNLEQSEHTSSLDVIAHERTSQDQLMLALDRLERIHRRNCYVVVCGKGGKARHVPFSIHLMRNLLQFGVWSFRREQLSRWHSADRNYRAPTHLFLSNKTRGPLTAGAIGDLLKDAFKAAGVAGSGHRLRAYYATKMASSLWAEAFANAGFRWDQRVENLVLDRLAEALGHARVTTTLRSYLDLALLECFGTVTKPKLAELRETWRVITLHHKTYSPEQLALIKHIAAAFGQGATKLQAVIAAALEDPELRTPSLERSLPSKEPPLRLIANHSRGE